MERKSLEALKQELAQAATQVTVGARYAHYKHPERGYRVTGLAIIEATEEVGVVYEAEYADQLTFIRPLSSWLDVVTHEGMNVPRFTKLQS